MNLTNIVTVTTAMDENTDHEVVVIYSKVELTLEDVEELHSLQRYGTPVPKCVLSLIELPGCLSWCRDGEFEEHETNLSRATGLKCYIVGNLS